MAEVREVSAAAGSFDDCDSGFVVETIGSTGVAIDPFPKGTTLGEAEDAFTGRFDCGPPEHGQDPSGSETSKFECTIAEARAEVGLDHYDGRVSAWVRPLGP